MGTAGTGHFCRISYTGFMQLRTLGALSVEGSDFNRAKPLLLLAYLALEGAKDSKQLAQLFFPLANKPSQSLATTLNRLRKGVPNCLERNEDQALLSKLATDATQVLSLLEAGDLDKGLELYGGRFLAGADIPDMSSELEEWIYATREFIAQRVRQALLSLGEKEQDNRKASQYAERAYSLAGAPEPSPEQFQRLYSLLHKGDSHLAPEVKHEAESFGIDVHDDPETNQEPLFVEAEKDITKASSTIKHNLPERLTSFVGRVSEVLELMSLLKQEDTRLLSLLGTGGVGKTSLSIQLLRAFLADVTRQEQDSSGTPFEGLYFVPLETYQSRAEIFSGIATSLALPLQPNQEVFEQVRDFLQDKRYLLVLDNFEHLVSKAGFVTDLLRACPNLKIVATSRERLNLSGELVYPMGGLELPLETDLLEQAKQRDAVRLFLERAKTADLRFSPDGETLKQSIEICNLVHGLPLGLELAAAWVKVMPVAEIREEIQANFDFLEATQQDVLGRHQSLRAVFEHSWKLLNQKEQDVLKHLAVFRGGFTREAAREVASATIPILMSLVDKSLVRVNRYRFDMHPLILQYATEKLAENAAHHETIKLNHVQYFLALAKTHPQDFYTLEQLPLLDQMTEELDNIWAAFDWIYKAEQLDLGLELANTLYLFWFVRGHFREGSQVFQKFHAKTNNSQASIQVAKGLKGLGKLLQHLGNYEEAKQYLEQSLKQFQQLKHLEEEAALTYDLGEILCFGGEAEEGKVYLEKALKRSIALNLTFLQSNCLISLSYLDTSKKDFPKRIEFARQGLTLKQELGDYRGEAVAMNQLALLHYLQGDWHLSEELFLKALRYQKHLGVKSEIVAITHNLSLLEVVRENYDKAKIYLAETIKLQYEQGFLQNLLLSVHIYLSLYSRLEAWHTVAHGLAAITRYIEHTQLSIPPRMQEAIQKSLDDVHEALGEAEYLNILAHSPIMTLEQIVTEMLSVLEE